MAKQTHAQKEFKKAAKLFQKKIYGDDEKDGIMCNIHDFFGKNDGKKHNCLGCNLDDATLMINKFLQQVEHDHLQFSFTQYFLLMYLTVERIETLFGLINLPDSYRAKHFHVFKLIKKWANFIKHPKAFILCHHPEYYVADDPTLVLVKKLAKTIIDDKFIIEYYSGDLNNAKLFKILTNQKYVIVISPSIVGITNDFCTALTKVVDLIKKNEVYREILSDQSTIKDFFALDEKELAFIMDMKDTIESQEKK